MEIDDVLSNELKKELGESTEYNEKDEENSSLGQQRLNKHQLKQLRKKQLETQNVRSKSQEKKEQKKEEARKRAEERLLRRDELKEQLVKLKIPEQMKDVIGKTSFIGRTKTDHQRYQEAIENKKLGLPYDQEILDKITKKKEESKKVNEMPLVIREINRDQEDKECEEDPLEKRIEPVKPLISPEVTVEKDPKVVERVPHEVIPAINVMLNRPEDVEESRSKLPIIEMETEIMELINDPRRDIGIDTVINDVVIVCGETGSGKTTQVPQFLYEAGYGTLRTKGKIAITEPRRVAAINMSKRVAYEMGFRHGAEVGYQIRHERLISDATVLKFMTDGVLLRELEADLLVTNYSVVIIDEAHERTVNTDVLIGLLSKVVIARREKHKLNPSVEPLKLIIMSATLRVEDFLNNPRLFERPPPLVKVEGRMYQVNAHFAEVTPSPDDINNTIKHLVDQLHDQLPPGSILVFVPGKQDIIELVKYFSSLPTTSSVSNIKNKAVIGDNQLDENGETKNEMPEKIENFDEMLREDQSPKVTNRKPLHILPLYSLLDPLEQAKVFDSPPPGKRVIIFATNVAETSLTIPGVRFVVDSGLEKVRIFNFEQNVIDAKVQYISKASAEQRMGRAGRTAPGYCFRLYSSGVFEHAFSQFSDPEILKRPIDEVVLLLKDMGLNDIARFPFPTQISGDAILESEKILQHLSAIEIARPFKITPLGRSLCAFPLSPRLAKVLVLANTNNVLDYAAIIVAALTVREPFESSPSEELNKQSKCGDVIRTLISFGGWQHELPKDRYKFCKEMGLRYKAMEDIQNIRMQLKKILFKADVQLDTGELDPPQDIEISRLCQAILGGYPERIAHHIKDLKYELGDGRIASISGTSSLAIKPPAFIVYTEVVNSENQLRLLNPTRIDPRYLMYGGSPLLLTKSKPRITQYNPEADSVLAHTSGTFGDKNWQLPETPLLSEDPYRFFASAILNGTVFPKLKQFIGEISMKLVSDLSTQTLQREIPQRNMMIVSQLRKNAISTKKSLLDKLKDTPSFLLTEYLYWIEDSGVHSKVQYEWIRLNQI